VLLFRVRGDRGARAVSSFPTSLKVLLWPAKRKYTMNVDAAWFMVHSSETDKEQ